MMTTKEQEDKVYEEFLKVKSDFETLLDRKITRRNFKKAIIDTTRIAAGELSKIDSDDRIRESISAFFKICHAYLGEVIWAEVKKKNLKIHICYEDTPMVSWNIPIDIFFGEDNQYKIAVKMLSSSMEDTFLAFFLCPALRDAVMIGEEEAVKHLYNSFNRPSMNSSLVNLRMLKECFPDFYDYITTELDIMSLEEMQEFIKGKSGKKILKKVKKTSK